MPMRTLVFFLLATIGLWTAYGPPTTWDLSYAGRQIRLRTEAVTSKVQQTVSSPAGAAKSR
jgi:hypothetical protein